MDSHFKDRQLPLPPQLNSAEPFLPPTLAAAPEIDDSPPSLEEIRNIVEKFKLGKAAGSDDLVNELLPYSSDCPDFIQILHELVTVVWESEDFPDQWRRATISTLHKKDNLAIPSNFRPLSLISTLSRTVTKLCRKRINARYHHVLDDCQYGFKQHVGTLDAIYCFKQLIKSKSEGMLCLFLDLRGAFDLLCRSQLHEIVRIMLGTTKIANILRRSNFRIPGHS